MAPFQTKWKPRVVHILVQHVLTSELTAPAVHKLATDGQIRGVAPEDVPPLTTFRYYLTQARKEREHAESLKTAEGMIGTLEDAHALAAKALMNEARRLTKLGKKATPAQWTALNKAIEAAAKARRALEGDDGRKRRPQGDNAPAEPAQEPGGFLSDIDPDA